MPVLVLGMSPIFQHGKLRQMLVRSYAKTLRLQKWHKRWIQLMYMHASLTSSRAKVILTLQNWRTLVWEFLLWLSELRSWLISMRMWFQSLVSFSELRIQHCCELWCRSQTQLAYATAAALKSKKQKAKKKKKIFIYFTLLGVQQQNTTAPGGMVTSPMSPWFWVT